MKTHKKLLTVAELAAALNCSPASIYRMIRDDIIPYYDLCASYRFDLDQVLEALQHRKS